MPLQIKQSDISPSRQKILENRQQLEIKNKIEQQILDKQFTDTLNKQSISKTKIPQFKQIYPIKNPNFITSKSLSPQRNERNSFVSNKSSKPPSSIHNQVLNIPIYNIIKI